MKIKSEKLKHPEQQQPQTITEQNMPGGEVMKRLSGCGVGG